MGKKLSVNNPTKCVDNGGDDAHDVSLLPLNNIRKCQVKIPHNVGFSGKWCDLAESLYCTLIVVFLVWRVGSVCATREFLVEARPSEHSLMVIDIAY